MSKTVSARISNKNHQELLQKCNKVRCTVNEWISETIQYLLTNSSDFDFGGDEEYNESDSIQTNNIKIQELIPNETPKPTVRIIE